MVTLSGIIILVSLFCRKALSPIVKRPLGKSTADILLLPKAFSPIDFNPVPNDKLSI